jgi:hypothetical protein
MAERAEMQFVYLLYAAGFVKVGRAGDVFSRVRQLQCGCPSKIEPVVAFGRVPRQAACDFESTMHYRLRNTRSHGEWFSCTIEQAVTLLAAHAASLVGPKFFTFDNPHAELVAKCVAREIKCRCYQDKHIQAAAAAEVDAMLDLFPSKEMEMYEAVERLPALVTK